MSCAMVLLDLKVILMLVCLNRLVILRMCGEVKVKVAHFVVELCTLPSTSDNKALFYIS